MRLFSTEQVSRWHPDKYADQISDSILTACLKEDPNSHCGIETLVKDDTIVLAGEMSTEAKVDVAEVARCVGWKLRYPVGKVINLISKQSPEIKKAVDTPEEIGAGDQGIMFGCATRDTLSFLPYGFDLANRIIAIIQEDVENNPDTILLGDAKTQVTVDLDKRGPDSINRILISAAHKYRCSLDHVKAYIGALMSRHLKDLESCDVGTLLINPAGTWTIAGPAADCGLTGRKIVCDQYGGYVPVGGGAFSGKDPSKVDRSASYMARHIAKELLEKIEAEEIRSVQVQLAYAIGVPEPVSVNVITDYSGDSFDEWCAEYIRKSYPLTPRGIIQYLDLLNKDYEIIAEGCHYRPM